MSTLEQATEEAFQRWFNHYLLNKTDCCLDRDILRWAKPILREGFILQQNTPDDEGLEWKGAQVYVDAYKEKTGGAI